MAARTRRDDWIFMLVQCSMKVLWCSDGKSSLGVVLDSVCCLCLRGGCRSACFIRFGRKEAKFGQKTRKRKAAETPIFPPIYQRIPS